MLLPKFGLPARSIDTALSDKNNFDALRFFAAIGVVFSHAYPVTQGSDANEVLFVLSGGKYTIGAI